MNLSLGLIIVGLAGVLQGTFFLPMTYTRKWEWAHKWFAFSLLAMLLVNWCIAFFTIGHIITIISAIPSTLLLTVLFFGFCWGVGAVFFGKAMDLLGMALGYPIIMGINAMAGTIIPALLFSPEIFIRYKGIMIITGALISTSGIVLCAKASAGKNKGTLQSKYSRTGLILAVISGFTSCLPNIGAAFSKDITAIALGVGVNSVLAGNVVWSLFFTMGAIVNAGYCLYLMFRNKDVSELNNNYRLLNWGLILVMSVMWIGSFYAYGIGSAILGDLGLIVGWPLLVSLSIVIGNLWGLFRREWAGAPKSSRNLLTRGIYILILSILIIASGNFFS
ncbi:MAG: hypothetical protein JXR41_07910 [Bacteroidales bacterium]|nr:hypothetical protein [Bacteroidales bacterium]